MGYEERYKELFSKLVSARFDKSKKGCAFCTVIDSIMSELAESESEDERIRKELICYFEKYPSIVIGPFNTKECIAWIEKQGEHAKFCDSIQVGDKVTRNQDGVLVNLSQLKRVAKPADKVEPKFKIGDTVTVKPMSCHGKVFKGEPFKIVDIIEDNYVSDDGKTYSISLQDGWELVEQKPVEWSEKDETMLNHCMTIVDTFFIRGHRLSNTEVTEVSILSWFKSLKDRCLPQPKQEWSEEDEYNLAWLVENLYGIEDEDKEYEKKCRKMADWLKSLRPQPRWKPSDLPHWKKSTLPNDNTTGFNSDYFCHKGYNINYKELFEKLPKDD